MKVKQYISEYWPHYLVGFGVILSGITFVVLLVIFLTLIGY